MLALAVLPGAASAQSVNTSADLAALNAYHTYLDALNADSISSANGASLILDGVTNTCPGALSGLTGLSAAQLKKSALSDFADEVDADLGLAYLAPSRPALNAFATSLTGLNWSTSTQDATTTHLISAERGMLRVAAPNLCADATTLDAAPLSEPDTTGTFLRHYRRAAGNVRLALKAFQALVDRFETKSEHRLVSQINTLVAEFSSVSSLTEKTDAAAILSALGVSSSGSSDGGGTGGSSAGSGGTGSSRTGSSRGRSGGTGSSRTGSA
jgi:hypothetical protein